MRDADGMVTYARMVALNASGIDPITATRELEEVLWPVIVVPAGVALIACTQAVDSGPFFLLESDPDAARSALVGRQLEFAGITVGDARPTDPTHANRA